MARKSDLRLVHKITGQKTEHVLRSSPFEVRTESKFGHSVSRRHEVEVEEVTLDVEVYLDMKRLQKMARKAITTVGKKSKSGATIVKLVNIKSIPGTQKTETR